MIVLSLEFEVEGIGCSGMLITLGLSSLACYWVMFAPAATRIFMISYEIVYIGNRMSSHLLSI